MEQLRETNTRVIFETEEIDTEKMDSCLMISIIESITQAENESRSDKWDNKQCAANGTSKLYDRKCYGYTNDEDRNFYPGQTAFSFARTSDDEWLFILAA